MPTVLLIEDNLSYAQTLTDAAYLKGITIMHERGLEEGMTAFKDDPTAFQGIILDGRGWLSEDAPTETSTHIHSAINQLTALKEQGIYIPYVINTGFFDQLSEQIQHIDPNIIFDKTHGTEPMFTKLLQLINNSPLQILKTKYPEPFHCFGGRYLPEAATGKLINLLTWLEDGTFNQNYFNSIRDLIEEMLKRANAIDSTNFLPSQLLNPVQNGRPNLKASELYLTGRLVNLNTTGAAGTIQAPAPIFSPHIGWLFSSVVTNAQILSHNYPHLNTPYAFRSAVFGLIEILIWFKNFVDQRYP